MAQMVFFLFFQTKHPDLTFIAKLWAPFNFEALGIKGQRLEQFFLLCFLSFNILFIPFLQK